MLANGWTPLGMTSQAWLRAMGWACALYVAAGASMIVGHLLVLPGPMLWPPANVVILLAGPVVLLPWATWLAGQRERATAMDPRWLRYAIRAGCAFWPISLGLSMLFPRWFSGRPIDFLRHKNLVESIFAAALTWLVWLRFARIVRRSNDSRSARWAAILCWVWPIAMIAQGIVLSDFHVLPTQGWLITPTPVIGEMMPVALLPYSLIHWPRVDVGLVAWTYLVAMTLATLALLARVSLLFFRTSRQNESMMPSSR